MPQRFEFASVNLDVNVGTEPVPAKPVSETPFRILLLGNFSGGRERAARGTKPVSIDRDNFDDVLAGMGVKLHLGGRQGGAGIGLALRSIEDFHPDRIYEQVDAFRTLREAITKAPPPPPLQPPPAVPSTGNLLDSVLEATESRPSTGAGSRDALDSFIEQVVAPHVLPREDPKLPELRARVDAASTDLMRAILHDRSFQALEAAWRGIHFLVRGLETNEQLKLYLLDVSKAELAGDLNLNAGPEPWAVVVGAFDFDRTESDIATLSHLGELMSAARAPFIAEANPGMDTTPEWDALRRSPAASWLALALPRFLLRLPYGTETEPIESFRFEEMPGTPVHQEYLWGNPAFACVYLLSQAFSSYGWDMRPGAYLEVEGLPLHVYEDAGEHKLKSCAEVEMTEEEAEWVLDQGCMPLVWVKGRASVSLLRFQSIADPLTPLSGPWS